MDELFKTDIVQESKELRAKFDFLIDEVVRRMLRDSSNQFSLQTLVETKNYGRNGSISNNDRLSQNFHDIESLAPTVAAIFMKNDNRARELENQIIDAIKKVLFEKLGYKMYDYVRHTIKPLVDKFSDTDIQVELNQCQTEEVSCLERLKEAYILLYAPFVVNAFPYRTLGFGSFLAYFSRVLKDDTQVFYGNKKMNEGETLVRQYLAEVLSRIRQKPTNVSLYEMIDLLHLETGNQVRCSGNRGNHCQKKPTLQALADEMNCPFDDLEVLYTAFNNGRLRCEGNISLSMSTCCQMLNMFKRDYKSTMKILKYSVQSPVVREPLKEITDIFGDLSFLGPYKNVTRYPKLVPRLLKTDFNARILMCRYAGKPSTMRPTNCDLFKRVVTNEGLGYSFNQAPFWWLFSKSSYTEHFAKIMKPKGYDEPGSLQPKLIEDEAQDEHSRWPYPGQGILFPANSGPKYGLWAILQGNNQLSNTLSARDATFEPFKVAIHDPMSIADLRGSGVEVQAGHVSTFLIKPLQIVTSKDAKGK